MSFTSPIFLFLLLPCFTLTVWLTRKRSDAKKFLVFFANAIFCLWNGAAGMLFVTVYSCVIWVFSIILTKKKNKVLFAGTLILAVMPLLTIKYSSFMIRNLNTVFQSSIRLPAFYTPIGISFFTFEALSFLSDVFHNRIGNTVVFTDTLLYLSFFPTITSGPIIRYRDFETGLRNPVKSADFWPAAERFALGICKKMLIADKLAPLANYYFDGIAAGNDFSFIGLWIGSFAYSLQLYFDFSGYTDMAIGIGRLLGFELCENFDHPYCASGITDFWRRWHISLSRWFRDYVYIPLGGNRCSVPRHVFNLLTVWLLTGIWHGADWSFVFWGLGYFILLLLEKYVPVMRKIGGRWFGHVYTLLCVNLLWVLFRAENLSTAGRYLAGMLRLSATVQTETIAFRFLPYLLMAMMLCLPWKRILRDVTENKWLQICRRTAVLLLGLLAICAVVNTNCAPYIYGTF